MLDLHQWLIGSYTIPAIEPPEGFEEMELNRLDNFAPE